MRASELFFPTLREAPTGTELISHQLLLRGGFIRQLAAGVFIYLPLGIGVLRKVENVVREEMNRAGAQEAHLSVLQPAELWIASGRWETFRPPLFKLRDQRGRSFCLGPTHEEAFAQMVRDGVTSYRDLPMTIYQIQVKFRDEERPRGGLLRGREFLMKDAYSFDATSEGLDVSYERMYEAYTRLFERCGVPCRVVEAAAGAMGGYGTREFMLEAPGGEDTLLLCDACEYAANAECAKTLPPDGADVTSPAAVAPTRTRRERVDTPEAKTVQEVCSLLEVAPQQLVKTLLYRGPDESFVAAMVRGDRELNEVKLESVSGLSPLEMASEAEIEQVTGGPLGFTGPVGLPDTVRLLADHEIAAMADFVTGANEADAHFVEVNVGADFDVARFDDLRVAVAGDVCPECREGRLEERRGIELGHVFKLGTKYAEDMGALFTDEGGVQRPIVMGCYGIGVSRIVAAVVEAHHDDDGIIWPMVIAPFQVVVLLLDDELTQEAIGLVEELQRRGVEVLLDERSERPGVKFKDADLIGIPLKAIIGRRTKADGVVEIQTRATGAKEMAPLAEAAERVCNMIAAESA